MSMFAFDVDETLALSGGPIFLGDLYQLRGQGHAVGLCGNWGLITGMVPGWHRFLSFVGPINTTKVDFLMQLKQYSTFDHYILVGNDHRLGQYYSPDDATLARAAGWEFIDEITFAKKAHNV